MKRKELKINQKLVQNFLVEVKGVDKEKHTLTAIVSTQDTDRHGDIVMQDGWDLKHFKKNPVILNSHNYGDATEVIGKATRTEVVGKGKSAKLEQDIQFAVNENPKAKVIFDLYAGGYLSAFSVGFIVRAFNEEDGKTDYWTIKEAELLEVSAVSVPANARALAKAKGIEVEVLEKDIDDEENEDVEIPDEDHDPEACEEVDCPKCEEAEEEVTPDPAPEDAPEPETPPEDPEPEAEPETPVEEEPEAPEEEPAPEPVQASFKRRALVAIHNISARERKQYERAGAIIQRILEGNENTHLPKKTQEQIRKRMVNQAIRALYEAK